MFAPSVFANANDHAIGKFVLVSLSPAPAENLTALNRLNIPLTKTAFILNPISHGVKEDPPSHGGGLL